MDYSIPIDNLKGDVLITEELGHKKALKEIAKTLNWNILNFIEQDINALNYMEQSYSFCKLKCKEGTISARNKSTLCDFIYISIKLKDEREEWILSEWDNHAGLVMAYRSDKKGEAWEWSKGKWIKFLEA